MAAILNCQRNIRGSRECDALKYVYRKAVEGDELLEDRIFPAFKNTR
jgi:hypothetical protein